MPSPKLAVKLFVLCSFTKGKDLISYEVTSLTYPILSGSHSPALSLDTLVLPGTHTAGRLSPAVHLMEPLTSIYLLQDRQSCVPGSYQACSGRNKLLLGKGLCSMLLCNCREEICVLNVLPDCLT